MSPTWKMYGLRRAVCIWLGLRKTEQTRSKGKVQTTSIVYEARLAEPLNAQATLAAVQAAFASRVAPPTTVQRYASYAITDAGDCASLLSEWDQRVVAAVLQGRPDVLSMTHEHQPEIPPQFRWSSIAQDETETAGARVMAQGQPAPSVGRHAMDEDDLQLETMSDRHGIPSKKACRRGRV